MPYQEVWVDDLELGDIDDDELISELEDRGYRVSKGLVIPSHIASELYNDYMTLSKESFEKKLKKFFLESLDIYVR